MGAASLWLLCRSRRSRLAAALPDQVNVEVVAAFMGLVVAAQVLEAAFLAPRIAGPWFHARLLVPALPFASALAAWGLRRFPRTGALLAVATVGLTVWVLVGALAGDATLAPLRGLY
jgi:hypothetical protein